MKKVLAIDLGASSGRGIVFQTDGNSLVQEEVYRFANNGIEQDGKLKWDIYAIFDNVVNAIRACKEKNIHIDSMAIDTWGVDYGFIDSDGRIISLPYHYRDARTQGAVNNTQLFTQEELYAMAGISLNEFNTTYQLIAHSQENEFKKAKKLLFMPNLLGYMLTNNCATEPTIASTCGFYVKGQGFSKVFTDKIEMDNAVMPNVLPTGATLGNLKETIKKEIGLDYDLPVVLCPGHDTACAVMAVPNKSKDVLFLSSGTWSLFGTLLDNPIANEVARKENYTNELAYGDKVRFLKNIMGMWIVQECKRTWEKEEPISFVQMVELAKDAQPFKAFINISDTIFNAPHDMPQRIVDYVKKTQDIQLVNKGEIVRCVYESLALEYKKAYEGLKNICGKTYDTLNIIGGGANNRMVSQFSANALNLKVVAGPSEGTGLGNALAQFIALGIVKDLNQATDLIAESQQLDYYSPQNVEDWEEAYKRYIQL